MQQIDSKPLSRDELERFLDAARRSPYFKRMSSTSGIFSLVRSRLPSLDGYKFNEFSDLRIGWAGGYEDGLVRDFVATVHDCEGYASYFMAKLAIAESGRPYNTAEGSDLQVSFGINQFGPAFRISDGVVSPGFDDLSYRRQLFNELLEMLGLLGRLEIRLDGDLLRLDVKDPGLLFPSTVGFRPSDYESRNRNLVRVDSAHPDKTNFHDLILNVFGLDELERRALAVVDRFGAAKVSEMSVSVLCRDEHYGPVRDRLNASPFTPWEISINVESAITLSDLDRAVAEYQSFMIHGFDLRVPKSGVLNVYVHHDRGEFSIDFQYRPSASQKRDDRLLSTIAELARAAGVNDLIPAHA